MDDPNPPLVDAYIENVEASVEWINWRDNLANDMWNSRVNYWASCALCYVIENEDDI